MNRNCFNCGQMCVSKNICVNCLDKAKNSLLNITIASKNLQLYDSDFRGKTFIDNRNKFNANLYFYIAQKENHTIIVIPKNGSDFEEYWCDDTITKPRLTALSEEVFEQI